MSCPGRNRFSKYRDTGENLDQDEPDDFCKIMDCRVETTLLQ